MKRIIIVILCFIAVFPQQDIKAEITEEEIKKVIEELVSIKDMEWEIVFGLPIEGVRLTDGLTEGRNIQYVIEHFKKYYEEDVLQQYLYYLKRSTQQELYYHQGVFWGSRFKVSGNIYKREATNLEYEIEYLSFKYHEDSVEVVTSVAAVYYGDYLIRGVKSNEYREDPKEYVFHLREDEEGNWKLIKLSDEVIDEIEDEIKESINSNQKEEISIYNEVKNLDGIEQYNLEDINLIYDACLRFITGGKDALYDQYEKVWLGDSSIYPEYSLEETDLLENFDLSNLRREYMGWDYGYIFKKWSFYEIIVFNIDNKDITRMSIMHFFEEEESENIEKTKKIIDPFLDALNQKYNILLGEAGGYENSREELIEFLERYYRDGLYGNKRWVHFYGQPLNTLGAYYIKKFVDTPRLIENAWISSVVINQNNNNFSRMYPPGKQTIMPYNNYKVISTQENIGNEIVTYNVEVLTQYFYEDINLFHYSRTGVYLVRYGGESEPWYLTVFTP